VEETLRDGTVPNYELGATSKKKKKKDSGLKMRKVQYTEESVKKNQRTRKTKDSSKPGHGCAGRALLHGGFQNNELVGTKIVLKKAGLTFNTRTSSVYGNNKHLFLRVAAGGSGAEQGGR